MSGGTFTELEARAAALDAVDPLAPFRARFHIPPGRIYLDGNSLGPLTQAARRRVLETLDQWEQDLIGGWNRHKWIDLPSKVGARIARIVGAPEDSVVVCDSTSINLFKLLASALSLRPGRTEILSTTDNFPTDLYVAEGLSEWLGAQRCTLRTVEPENLERSLGNNTAAVLLSHVNFRTGHLLDIPLMTQRIHAAGALAVWDLAHSAGVIPMRLAEAGVDLAAGCGYKYLNGGPGAPSWLYVHPSLHAYFRQPLSGWMGHADPFAFEATYRPAHGPRAALSGTPSVLSLASLDGALELWEETTPEAVRRKSISLTSLFIEAVSTFSLQHGVRVATPLDPSHRGSQVALAHPMAFQLVQALIARGVVGDFRVPDLMRFGFSPLQLTHAEIVLAAKTLQGLLESGDHLSPQYSVRGKVT